MRPVLLVLLTGLAICPAVAAEAQQPNQAQANAIRQSCRGDYQAHCAGVATGGAAALQCLRQNMASLSPGCQSAVAATEGGAAATPPTGVAPQGQSAPPMMPRERAMEMRRACGGDFRQFCPGVRAGGGRALACLTDHRESLSPNCRDLLASARGQ